MPPVVVPSGTFFCIAVCLSRLQWCSFMVCFVNENFDVIWDENNF